MIQRKREKFPIYDIVYLDIVIADNDDELNEMFPRNKEEQWFACVFRTEVGEAPLNWRAISVVFNVGADKDGSHNIITPAIIVHECVHIKNRLFTLLNIRSKAGRDEQETYFMEWLFKEISNEVITFKMKLEGEQLKLQI